MYKPTSHFVALPFSHSFSRGGFASEYKIAPHTMVIWLQLKQIKSERTTGRTGSPSLALSALRTSQNSIHQRTRPNPGYSLRNISPLASHIANAPSHQWGAGSPARLCSLRKVHLFKRRTFGYPGR